MSWSRYDTPGRTIYASDTKLTAYLELLAPYRTEVAERRRALKPLADAAGVDLNDMWKMVVEDWETAGHMHANWLPSIFREGRSMYSLAFPEGWWIDIVAAETITALHDLFETAWPTASGISIEPLTLSHLTSDDRILTSAIATHLREQVTLDDGSLPLGIRFVSKHGVPAGASGASWAYWMRDVDAGLEERAIVTEAAPIDEDDADFLAAQRHCKIKSR